MIWAARHAAAGVAGVCYGRSDVAVSVSSDDAAAQLLASLPHAERRPACVWSSPSPRCHDPAQRLAERGCLAHRTSEALYELDFGTWEGQTWDAIARDDAASYRAWAEHWTTAAPPNGEALSALEARVRAWVNALSADCTHFLVAHAGVVRALRVLVGGASWDEAMREPVPHLTWVGLHGR